MHEQLIKEIQKTVRDGEVPAKSVAEAVGKPYSTLMREINPYDKGAKLGVETFMATSLSPTSDVGFVAGAYRGRQAIAVRSFFSVFIPQGKRSSLEDGRTVVKPHHLEV